MKAISALKHILFLLKNEIKRTYSGSLLGIIWFILNPILYSLVYYFLFEKIIQIRFNFKIPHVSYFEYLIIGLILWNSFVSSTLRSAVAIVENAYILKKVFIRSEYFPIVYTLMYSLQGLIFLSILIIFFKVFSLKLIFSYILAYFNFFLFISGLAFILSALTVYIRDIPQILNNFMNFVFYTIPIIYPYESIPPNLKSIVFFNPLVYVFKPFHDILFYKELDINVLGIGFIISSLTFFFGFLVFQKLKHGFYDVL